MRAEQTKTIIYAATLYKSLSSPLRQQARDGSVDSREGSVSPTRRRKKSRRMSAEGSAPPAAPAPLPLPNDNAQSNGEDAPMKEEPAREHGVEDLTLDEEPEEEPAVTHNDVVRSECPLNCLMMSLQPVVYSTGLL